MPVTDERLHQLAYDPMMCNITPEVLECLRELNGLRWKKATVEDLPPIGTKVLAAFEGQFEWVMFPASMTKHNGIYAPGYATPTHWRPWPTPPAPRPA